MKAIRVHEFGGPDVLRLEEVPEPTPGQGEVVVRTRAIGVNPVEAYIRGGTYGARDFPFTPGADCAGEVVAVGAGVRRFLPGQRVYTAGTIRGAYAELVVSAEASVHPLPDRVSFEQGAAIGVPCATAYTALFVRAVARPGETVLVNGASGGVGLAAVQLARAAGLIVIGTAGTDAGLRVVAEQGAHHAVSHGAADKMGQIMALTGGRGLDVIVEMLANQNLAEDLKLLARRGRVVVVGSRGPVTIDPRESMSREADVRGMSLANATEADRRTVHAALGAALENGTLCPIIGTVLPLRDAAAAHRVVLEGHAPGKIVLVP
jgi:NADPH2:quinone reductase